MDCNSCKYSYCRYWPALCATFDESIDKEIFMAQDIAGESGKVSVKLDEKEAMIIRNALRMYVASKVRAANANSDDADLNMMYNAQARNGSELSRKFGG